jgi:uncharacterized MAPEG superfamily protein
MGDALIVPMAVGTGVVVIVVAVAVVLVVLLVTASMRGNQRRGAKRRAQARDELGEAHERAERAERDRDVAQEPTRPRSDADR